MGASGAIPRSCVATILDFGCGIGSSVRALLAQGYDAYGVDVLEYWDRDFDKYWLIGDKPPAEVADRLKLADPGRVRSNTEIMRFNNYPTKAKLRRIARSAGADISFVETEAFLFRGGGRAAPMLKWLRTIKLDRLAVQIAGTVMLQRYMIVKPRPRSGLTQPA